MLEPNSFLSFTRDMLLLLSRLFGNILGKKIKTYIHVFILYIKKDYLVGLHILGIPPPWKLSWIYLYVR